MKRADMAQYLERPGEEVVEVACEVMKVRRTDLKRQRRLLLVSDTGVYNIKPGGFLGKLGSDLGLPGQASWSSKRQWCVPLERLSSVSAAADDDTLFVLHFEKDQDRDYTFSCPARWAMRDDVLCAIRKGFEARTGRPLPLVTLSSADIMDLAVQSGERRRRRSSPAAAGIDVSPSAEPSFSSLSSSSVGGLSGVGAVGVGGSDVRPDSLEIAHAMIHANTGSGPGFSRAVSGDSYLSQSSLSASLRAGSSRLAKYSSSQGSDTSQRSRLGRLIKHSSSQGSQGSQSPSQGPAQGPIHGSDRLIKRTSSPFVIDEVASTLAARAPGNRTAVPRTTSRDKDAYKGNKLHSREWSGGWDQVDPELDDETLEAIAASSRRNSPGTSGLGAGAGTGAGAGVGAGAGAAVGGHRKSSSLPLVPADAPGAHMTASFLMSRGSRASSKGSSRANSRVSMASSDGASDELGDLLGFGMSGLSGVVGGVVGGVGDFASTRGSMMLGGSRVGGGGGFDERVEDAIAAEAAVVASKQTGGGGGSRLSVSNIRQTRTISRLASASNVLRASRSSVAENAWGGRRDSRLGTFFEGEEWGGDDTDQERKVGRRSYAGSDFSPSTLTRYSHIHILDLPSDLIDSNVEDDDVPWSPSGSEGGTGGESGRISPLGLIGLSPGAGMPRQSRTTSGWNMANDGGLDTFQEGSGNGEGGVGGEEGEQSRQERRPSSAGYSSKEDTMFRDIMVHASSRLARLIRGGQSVARPRSSTVSAQSMTRRRTRLSITLGRVVDGPAAAEGGGKPPVADDEDRLHELAVMLYEADDEAVARAATALKAEMSLSAHLLAAVLRKLDVGTEMEQHWAIKVLWKFFILVHGDASEGGGSGDGASGAGGGSSGGSGAGSGAGGGGSNLSPFGNGGEQASTIFIGHVGDSVRARGTFCPGSYSALLEILIGDVSTVRRVSAAERGSTILAGKDAGLNKRARVETFGKTIENAEILPLVFHCLEYATLEEQRDIMKDVNSLLVMRTSNFETFVGCAEWCEWPLRIYTRLPPTDRSPLEEEIYKYTNNFYHMVHHYLFSNGVVAGGGYGGSVGAGDIDKILLHDIRCIEAFNGGWSRTAVGLARRWLMGLLAKIGASAKRHSFDDPEEPEPLFNLLKLISFVQDFTFLMPTAAVSNPPPPPPAVSDVAPVSAEGDGATALPPTPPPRSLVEMVLVDRGDLVPDIGSSSAAAASSRLGLGIALGIHSDRGEACDDLVLVSRALKVMEKTKVGKRLSASSFAVQNERSLVSRRVRAARRVAETRREAMGSMQAFLKRLGEGNSVDEQMAKVAKDLVERRKARQNRAPGGRLKSFLTSDAQVARGIEEELRGLVRSHWKSHRKSKDMSSLIAGKHIAGKVERAKFAMVSQRRGGPGRALSPTRAESGTGVGGGRGLKAQLTSMDSESFDFEPRQSRCRGSTIG